MSKEANKEVIEKLGELPTCPDCGDQMSLYHSDSQVDNEWYDCDGCGIWTLWMNYVDGKWQGLWISSE